MANAHWYGDRSWQTPNLKIDNSIKDNFRAGESSARLHQTVLELLNTKYRDYQHRYTDGSLSRFGTGIGIHDSESDISLRLPNQCSVFSAEAAAILIATATPSSKPLLILSDSASVLAAIQSQAPKHAWIQAIIQCSLPSTVFMWIPGHCNIAGNNIADRLAGAGHSGPLHTNRTPLPDVKKWIDKAINTKWQLNWNRNDQLFIRKIKQSIGTWNDLKSLRDQRVISRLRTGHTKVSHNMGSSTFRNSCEICRIPLSVEHFLCVCPQYELLRNQYNISGSIRDTLGNDASTLEALIHFLKDANLYQHI